MNLGCGPEIACSMSGLVSVVTCMNTRRGARSVALDYAEEEVVQTRHTLGAMLEAGEIPPEGSLGVLRGDATSLPFDDGCFDVVITSEVLEHIQDDRSALSKWFRCYGQEAGLQQRFAQLPETINWWLSDGYHAPKAPEDTFASTAHRTESETAFSRSRCHRRTSRSCTALAVLVAEVCGGGQK